MFTTAPAVIEQTDFTFGWAADGESAHRGPTELEDVLNMQLDEATTALVTRGGFERVMAELTGEADRYIITLEVFRGRHDFIAVTTDGTASPNNVKIYYVETQTWSATRIDTAGRTWANPKEKHWGMVIDNIYYGGVRGEELYSYTPQTSAWDATAATGNFKALVDDTGVSVNTATSYARDYAFTGDERVTYGGSTYSPVKSIRFDSWDDDVNRYSVGDKVHRKTDGYAKAYRCIKSHDPSDGTTVPDTGGAWTTYWKRVRLSLPTDDDGNTENDWDFVPLFPHTGITAWFADRMWARSEDTKDRLMFSAPIKIKHGEDIPDTVWHPYDWQPGNDANGPGGGWLDFGDGRNNWRIHALAVFGQYLIVFKGANIYALSGFSEDTFTPRHLARGVGTHFRDAHCQHRGLLYFLGNDGVYVTDGTQVEPVQGSQKLRNWFRSRIDGLKLDDDGESYEPTMFSHGDYVYVSMPDDGADDKYRTIAYHPETGSFWQLDLPILDTATVLPKGTGVSRLYMVTPASYGLDIIYELFGEDSTLDDDGTADAEDPSFTEIAWHVRTSWWPFGVRHVERRIRKVWAIVRGSRITGHGDLNRASLTFTIKAWKDWGYSAGSPVASTDTSGVGTDTKYIEGEWFADSHAVMFEVSSTGAPATVHGIAVDTQPRRERYHN